MVRAVRLALGGRSFLGCRLGRLRHLLWHYQRAQLGVGGQHAVLAKRGSAHFAQRSYADTKADQVQPWAWHRVVLGAFTNCEPGNGYGTLTLDEVFDDYFKPLGIPAWRGAQFGHIKKKWTLPIGLPVEMDAGAGTLRLLSAAVA